MKNKLIDWDTALILDDEEIRMLYLNEIAKFKNKELMDYAKGAVERSRIIFEQKSKIT